MATPLRWLAYGLVALGAAVTGAYVHERLGGTPHPAPTLHVLTPTPAPGRAEGAIPELRPEFTLQDADGRAHTVTEWDGHPLMINFWATWCAPCRREIPLLNRLQAEPALVNRVAGFAPCPPWRPQTKFERRGLTLGHGVWDLVFERRVSAGSPSPA